MRFLLLLSGCLQRCGTLSHAASVRSDSRSPGLTLIIANVINAIIMTEIIIDARRGCQPWGLLHVLSRGQHENRRFGGSGHRRKWWDRTGVRPRVAEAGRDKDLSRRT